METRKVQQVGGGTYTVSIPVSWAKEHGVQAGGTAYLYTHRDGSLVVRWDEKEDSELAATEVAIDGADPGVAERLLDAAYTAGFERVTLRAADGVAADQRRAISARARTLSGVDVTEETETSVTVQGLLDPGDVSIRQSVLQLRFTTLSMLEAAMAAFAGEAARAEHVVERNGETDRAARLVERHVNRSLVDLEELDQLGTTRRQLFAYYCLTRELERTADHAASVARAVRQTDREPDDDLAAEVAAVGADAREVVEDASEALVDGDAVETAHAAYRRHEEVVRRAESVDRAVLERDPDAAHLLARVVDRLRRVAEHGGNVAELALQSSLLE